MMRLAVVLVSGALMSLSLAAASAEPEAILAIMKDVEQATNTRDVTAILKHASDGIVMVSKNGEIVVGKKALAAYLEKMLGALPSLKEIKSATRDPRVWMAAADMAIVDGRSDDYYAFTSGLSFSMTTNWSATVVKHNGTWRIAALHFSFNLFDNPVLSTAQRAVYWAAALALVFGLLLSTLGVIIKNHLKSNT